MMRRKLSFTERMKLGTFGELDESLPVDIEALIELEQDIYRAIAELAREYHAEYAGEPLPSSYWNRKRDLVERAQRIIQQRSLLLAQRDILRASFTPPPASLPVGPTQVDAVGGCCRSCLSALCTCE